jgi:hypothetical protein
MRWAVNGFGSHKTAGEGGIFPSLLQQGNETMVVPLGKIITACLDFGYVPKVWAKSESYINTHYIADPNGAVVMTTDC